MNQTKYGFSHVTNLTYEEADRKIRENLKGQGFGVLTEINVQKTLKEKIGVDFRRYKILGACNPKFAHKALTTETEIGLMMPCNVIVYENDDGKTVVAAIDPTAAMGAVGNENLREFATQVCDKLKTALAAL